MSWLDADFSRWDPVDADIPALEIDPPGGPDDQVEEDEQLPEYVQGHKASDIEARFFIAASEHPMVSYIDTQVSYVAGRNLPGEIRLDFLVYGGGILFPVFVDGDYWHKEPERKQIDARQEDIIDMILQGTYCMPVQRVPGTDLEDLEEAAKTVDKVLAGRYLMNR